MSRRVLIVIAILVAVIALGIASSLKRALKMGASSADPDSGSRHPPASAPR